MMCVRVTRTWGSDVGHMHPAENTAAANMPTYICHEIVSIFCVCVCMLMLISGHVQLLAGYEPAGPTVTVPQ